MTYLHVCIYNLMTVVPFKLFIIRIADLMQSVTENINISLSEFGEHVQSEAENNISVVSLNSLQVSEEAMKCDNYKVLFHTGLPYFSTLVSVVNFVSPKQSSKSGGKLNRLCWF